jgi:ATP-dependent DNA helicase RecQ
MQDQVSALAQLGVRAAFLNSTLSSREAWAVEQQVRAGELDLLYVAPERLLMDRTLALLEASRLALFAIDEAHCVSQWGHDFRPEYGQLSLLRERFPEVPRVALTATADEPTRREIAERLLVEPRIFVASFDRPNIRYRIVDKRDARRQLLDFIVAEHTGDDGRSDSGIVYCLARAKTEEVAAFLCEHGIDALPYHAGLDADVRRRNQARFLRDDHVVMVATIAFGMGIDKPDVRFVAHLDMPKSVEGYFQETGRGGRDGAAAQAWMAYGLADVVQQRRLIELSEADDDYKRLSASKLDAMLALCETAGCRRVRLLAYFGESSVPCGNCDNCLEPPAVWNATEAARKLMSCIWRCEQASGFPFAASHVIDVLRGKASEKVEKFGHAALSTFGIGADLSEADWRLVLRQLVAHHLVEVDVVRFNTLRLTDASRTVLRGEQIIEVRRHVERPAKERRRRGAAAVPEAAALDGSAQVLFDRLRAWRAETARAQNVPAYIVFHDSQLRAIALARPDSRSALSGLPGVGERKLAAYGEALLTLVAGAG